MWRTSIILLIFGLKIVHSKETSDHAGIFTNNLETAHLVIPRKVNKNGEELSNYLTHYHDGNSSNAENQQLHIQLELNNEMLHLELEPSTMFVAPSMIIERHRREVRVRKKSHKNKNCHFQGHVRGHDNSKVAISTCDGIAGFMRTKKGEYWIEPSKNHPHTKQKGHPHVVFQRSAVKNNNKNQNNNNKKKKKLRRRKKRHPSNCGTKEPKRLTETKIEWQPQGKVIVQGGRKTRTRPNEYSIVSPTKRDRRAMRARRSISAPQHVEALVVADPSMVFFHQDGDVETYLLTIMNMVSSLYKDPNIGNLIHVVVVKILLLEEEDDSTNLNITHVAGTTLESFCNWQRDLNPGEDDPFHHDVAILITRTNICSVSGCSTLGVANVGGMCRPDRSCSVNEDNGITLAHTITHELGHNFGMYHDTAKTGCDNRIGPILHIMTPSFEADTVQVSWSNCSRKYITNFLDQGKGRCLQDVPNADGYDYPELPPGAMYNADLQCRLQFNSTDETISVCSRPNEICSQLWCMVDGACTTLLRPAAAGTHCEKHKWCQNQDCVPIEDLPDRVDGGWGNWTGWSDCSKTCGAGIAKQLRECNHPAPAFGGSFCVGERSRYKICNVEECSKAEPSFRAIQCTQYNNKTFKGQNYTWLPYFDISTPCELLCTDSDDTMIVPFGDSAADGTPCNIGTNDMCIDGICRKVGCDWAVDSNTTEDQCGVCGGNGKTCTTIKGEFIDKMDMIDGFHEIVLIPMGSRNVVIEEMGPSKNFIGIGKASSKDSKDFYLNGNGMIFMSGEYEIAGTMGLYERTDDQEKLKIPGPIKYNISLNIVFRGKHKNLGVKYEYTLPTNLSAIAIHYWELSDFTPCSATCGGGTKYKFPVCYQIGEGVVSDDDCVTNAENKRPEKIIKICNEDSCPAFWWIGPWQLCQVTCQKLGEPKPIRKRSIMCVDQNEMALPDARCTENRPVDTEPCPDKLPFCNLDGTDYDANDVAKDILEDGNEENNTI